MQMTKEIQNQTMYLLNLLDVNGYLFCKETKRKHYNIMKPLHCKKKSVYFFYQKCGLTCRKFQVSHARRNHCLWDDIYFERVFFVSLDSFD